MMLRSLYDHDDCSSLSHCCVYKILGNRDNTLHLPMNDSISMNLDGLYTRTTVSFQPSMPFGDKFVNRHEILKTF